MLYTRSLVYESVPFRRPCRKLTFSQIQQEVIKAYGFNKGEVKMYKCQDPEIAAMCIELNALLLSPMSTPPTGGELMAS
uniref:Uncharacterized protein n=1 Tax=Scleropages formosus TaxID=113540 RepID=A0A8C9V2L8_SCLFO